MGRRDGEAVALALDIALRGQAGDGLVDRRATDVPHLLERPLGGKPASGFQAVLLNVIKQFGTDGPKLDAAGMSI